MSSHDEQPEDNDRVATESGRPDVATVSRRRALLGAISAAGVAGATQLPQQWSRPVVDNVILPAHAQLSPAGTQTVTCNVTCTDGFAYEYESISSSTSFVNFLGSAYLFTACVSQPEGGDISSTSVFSSTFTVTGTTADPGTLASSCIFSTFTEDGICEEPIG